MNYQPTIVTTQIQERGLSIRFNAENLIRVVNKQTPFANNAELISFLVNDMMRGFEDDYKRTLKTLIGEKAEGAADVDLQQVATILGVVLPH